MTNLTRYSLQFVAFIVALAVPGGALATDAMKRNLYDDRAAAEYRAAERKAGVDYRVGAERCKGLPQDSDRLACMKRVRTVHDKARSDARRRRQWSIAHGDAVQERRRDDFRIASELCEGLHTRAKQACMNETKARYGIN